MKILISMALCTIILAVVGIVVLGNCKFNIEPEIKTIDLKIKTTTQ